MKIVIVFVGILLILVVLGLIAFLLLKPTGRRREFNQVARTRERLETDVTGSEQENLNRSLKKARTKKAKPSKAEVLNNKLTAAGYYGESKRANFRRLQVLSPIAGLGVGSLIGFGVLGFNMVGVLTVLLMTFAGFVYPTSSLDKRIAKRGEDALFYLPLVIEEIAIGVSSSLDIGPCLRQVVTMADERGTSNIVIELIKQVLNYVRSGLSLEEALEEIGEGSGIPEIKHTFSSLAQVSKHGGEITKQLQELADAISTQRETMIDGKIKTLELKATGPLALVFLGFLIIMMAGIFVNLKNKMTM